MSIAIMLFLTGCIIAFIFLYQRRVIAHQLELKKINEQKEVELIQAAIKSEEEERLRIATELHDDVNATLASARLFLYKNKEESYDETAINQSKELVDESINKIRNISQKLQPTSLQLGLEVSIQALAEKLNKSGKIAVSHKSLNSLLRIEDGVELAAYRISQELLTNIVKHTEASYIEIITYTEENEATILFTHDGIGMTQSMYEEQIFKKGATGLKTS